VWWPITASRPSLTDDVFCGSPLCEKLLQARSMNTQPDRRLDLMPHGATVPGHRVVCGRRNPIGNVVQIVTLNRAHAAGIQVAVSPHHDAMRSRGAHTAEIQNSIGREVGKKASPVPVVVFQLRGRAFGLPCNTSPIRILPKRQHTPRRMARRVPNLPCCGFNWRCSQLSSLESGDHAARFRSLKSG
jgi:hypothetical protein